MKKFLAVLCAAFLAVGMAAGLIACSKDGDSGAVVLTEVSADYVGLMDDIDYYVVPEPAASAKVKKLTAEGSPIYNVGSLQELYGNQGYPQAVIVAKNRLIESDGAFVKEFVTKFSNTATWLSSTTDYASIVSNINAAGGTTLKAPQLTSTVIANCNINYVSALADKSNVLSYMQSVKAINSKMYGECADSFFFDTTALTQTADQNKTSVSVYMPDGAPALSMAYMMSGEGDTLSKTVNYNVVAANTINTYVTNENQNKNADICILPVNAAAQKLGSGSNYKLLGTVTHGNLFLLSKEQTAVTSSNAATILKGKKIGVINLAAVPGLTFKMILNNYSLEYSQDNK